MNQLMFSKAAHGLLRERLLAEDPTLDEQTLADTLEGLTDLNEIIAAIVRAAVTDEALSDGLRARMGEMLERQARFDDRAAKRRELACEAMAGAAIKKITAPDMTISLRAGPPSLVVIDETVIPQSYWVARQPRLDRQSLQADLKRGAAIAGVSLSNSEPVLSVRIK